MRKWFKIRNQFSSFLTLCLWCSVFLLLLVTVSPNLFAQSSYPQWWYDRGVIVTNTGVITNDYAAINAGQLKYIASMAKEELDAKLPGGCGPAVSSMVGSFTLSNNYCAVNIGQLKNVSAPFWARLIEAGYTNDYPWTTNTTADDNDFAIANIGQVKNVFSFDLSNFTNGDSDGDSLPDTWEIQYFGDTTTYTGFDDPDNDGMCNYDEYVNYRDPSTGIQDPVHPAVSLTTIPVFPSISSITPNATNGAILIHKEISLADFCNYGWDRLYLSSSPCAFDYYQITGASIFINGADLGPYGGMEITDHVTSPNQTISLELRYSGSGPVNITSPIRAIRYTPIVFFNPAEPENLEVEESKSCTLHLYENPPYPPANPVVALSLENNGNVGTDQSIIEINYPNQDAAINVTGLNVGTGEVYARRCYDMATQAIKTYNVTEGEPENPPYHELLTVTINGSSTLEKGSSSDYIAIVFPSNLAGIFTWSLEGSGVISVSGSGSNATVTALDYGSDTLKVCFSCTSGGYGGSSASGSLGITVTEPAPKVDIIVGLEDHDVNGVKSGLNENTLRFELNGNIIPNSNLTLQRTTEDIDGEQILTRLDVIYKPSYTELYLHGSNMVKVDIDDMVDNHLDQLVNIFQLP